MFKMFSKAFDIFKKLHIGLYIYFIFLIIAVEYPLDMFESYSLVDSRSVKKLVVELVKKAREEKPRAVSADETKKLVFSDNKTILDDYKDGFQFTTGGGLVDVLISRHDKDGGFSLKLERRFEDMIAVKYPVFSIFGNDMLLPVLAFVISIWLWPYYKFSFWRSHEDMDIAEKRVINLPVFILSLIWIFAVFKLVLKCAAYYLLVAELPNLIFLMFFVSFLVFGTITSLLSLGLIQQYVNNNISAPFFKDNEPFKLRSGYSINLTLRFIIIIFCVGVVPTALGVYLPLSFNIGILSDTNDMLKMLDNFDKIVPVVTMMFFALYFLIMQAVSVFSFRKNIIIPVNNLVRRMKLVSKGDFNCKTPVLYVDEIGQLKGHFNLMLDGLIEREKVKDTFGRFISFEIAEKLMKNEKLNLMGEEVEATILFSDIRDFTPLSEKLSPEGLVEFLNLYFSHIVGPIHKNHGIINKFMGDAVMAIFSPLFGEADHEKAAVRAGLEMKRALEEFNGLKKYSCIKSGIGIHTGKLIAGNIGTRERMEYTFIGDNVNIAARIESETKNFNTDILMSKTVIDKIKKEDFPQVDFVEHGPVMMKGKSVPLILYGVLLK